uniref:FBD domain-containing protein n=1 Tax=Arundo donax TaxID=35708 RepID=A0A0A9CD24_ARUDO
MAHLQVLLASYVLVYGPHDTRNNRAVQMLLKRFQVIHRLAIALFYQPHLGNCQYLMEDITVLPHITFLSLMVISNGHTFGASSFHVLRLCTGVRRMLLMLKTHSEAQPACSSFCICDELTNWKTEELNLNCLQEVEISYLTGVDHEVAFVKCLFRWATVLETIKINFHHSISGSKVRELCETLLSFSRSETCVEFYLHRNAARDAKDQGTGLL